MKRLLLIVFVLLLALPTVASAYGCLCVTITEVTAERVPGGVVVRWETVNEFEYAGYNVLMERKGRMVRLNAELIPAQHPNELVGGEYEYRVKGHRRATYWLEVVRLDGGVELWRVE